MHVLVTGSQGFIGRNLLVRLRELPNISVLEFNRHNSLDDLKKFVAKSDFIIHFAAENRPTDKKNFFKTNVGLTNELCDAVRFIGRNIPIIFTSSVQANLNNFYGQSKLKAEQILKNYAAQNNGSVLIYRLTGVFGKWCKPNYNSVVATFCYNIARNLPIKISDEKKIIQLSYIDDVVDELILKIRSTVMGFHYAVIEPQYEISLGDLANQINRFRESRKNLMAERVGFGLKRALYSTYLSYLPENNFAYDLHSYSDERGKFIEILKTPDCGQFSFLTIFPGITRGSHYHHSKTEKFIVVHGIVKVRFRKLLTEVIYEVILSAEKPQVVDTIPGWIHDITNIGESEAIVMLWANEVFDHDRPDCIPCKV